MEVQALFVYGTLRPDDDSGAAWTRQFLEGMDSRRAILRNAQLFFDVYPCAVLGVSCRELSPAEEEFIVVRLRNSCQVDEKLRAARPC